MIKKASFDFLRRVLTKCRVHVCILPDDGEVPDMGLRDVLGQGSGVTRRLELKDVRERTLYSFRDGFGCSYMFFRMGERVVSIGPWLREAPDETFLAELGGRVGAELTGSAGLRRYFEALPRLPDNSPLFAVVEAFLEEVWRDGYATETFSSAPAARYSPPIRKALLYVESSIGGELTLSRLASEIGLNPSYLSDLFKKETGRTLTEHVNLLRISRARRMLRETTLQVQAVAQNCGIHDVNYFSKVFKKYTGKTPLQYRKEN